MVVFQSKGLFFGEGGGPIIRTIVFFGVYVGVPYFWETTKHHKPSSPKRFKGRASQLIHYEDGFDGPLLEFSIIL